jgi:uncharacterized protein with PIN domain
LPEPTTAKDALEGLGIPHTEADLLLVEGQPIDFSYRVRSGERLEVYPPPPPGRAELDWAAARLQPRPLTRKRFICDQHLGKLARWLRILGFDTHYARTESAADITRLARDEDRAVLTCSRGLLQRKAIDSGRLIRSRELDLQLVEVVQRFRLKPNIKLFQRCNLCNGTLATIAKEAVWDRIPQRTRNWRDTYFRCQQCAQLYWEGTHVTELRRRVAAILAQAEVQT